MLDRILSFMTLALKVENGNMKQPFNFSGTDINIPIVGNIGKPGIMDMFINWGDNCFE